MNPLDNRPIIAYSDYHYSHINWTTIDPLGDPVSTPMDSQNPVFDTGDFECIGPDGEVEVSDAPDNGVDWEDLYEDSDSPELDDPTIDQDKEESVLDSEEEMGTFNDSEPVHPEIDVLEYDDYRY